MTKINFLKKLDKTPEIDTSIYRLKKPRVDEPTLLETAKLLKLKGDKESGAILASKDKLTYTEGSFVVSLCGHSGGMHYYDRSRYQVDDGKSQIDFSDDKAVDIAKKFIDQSKLVGKDKYKMLKVSHLNVGSIERGSTKAEERVIDVGVAFTRTIDEVPVEGPGGKVVVYIDHKGEVTGCKRIWREIEKVHVKVPHGQLQSPKFAEEDLSKYWQVEGIKNIDVMETRFGYFEFGWGKSQQYLHPTYVMPLTLVSTERRVVMKSVHVVSAAPKPIEPIMPPHKVKRKEPIRKE
jgi:hypothetical protein